MRWYRLLRMIVVGSCFAGLSACGGGGGSANLTPCCSPPSISSITPSSVTAGGGAFALTVNGSGFVSGSSVTLTFSDRHDTPGTTIINSTQLTALISAADIAIPGSGQITVSNPQGSPGSGNSNPVGFVIQPRAAGIIQTISQNASGGTPNGNSHEPALSATGRVVAFASEATDLISPNTMFAEAYLRDTCLGVNGCTPSTQLVSAITGGSIEGNGLGGATPSVAVSSVSGNVIGFTSTATNLVTPNTTSAQAFVRDACIGVTGACTPTTVLASVTQNGGEPNGASTGGAVTGSGCGFAYVSNATNVVSGVTTPNEVYLSTCSASGAFASANLVSADNAGIAANQGASQAIGNLSGRFVAFASGSTNLPGAPGGGTQQIYLRNTCLGGPVSCTPSTVLISVDNSGSPLAGSSGSPAISDDGRFVVFANQAPLPGGGVTSNVWLRDTCNSDQGPVANCTPGTTAVSVAADGSAANGPSNSSQHAISGDGRLVLFSSSATNLINGGNPAAQVFVRDTCNSSTGTISGCSPRTVLISVDNTGAAIGGFAAAISRDGHVAAFENETQVAGVSLIFLAATSF